ncbi:unnamed protein product [Spirodela intermedia]|uniref:EF-hand domain-containing protein n=1 Tax=Spirodela intermedia TaxID=51605 RepID=A0A7I8K067_SPIIN|nr:unnamed protein product [Spirodela intermedia]
MESFFHSTIHLLVELLRCYMKSMRVFSVSVEQDAADHEHSGGEEEEQGKAGDLGAGKCESCQKNPHRDLSGDEGRAVIIDDVETVMGKLGLEISEEEGDETWEEGECSRCRLVKAASRFLEEKVASDEELLRAFSVFDRNGDGFITPVELRSVMVALGFTKGRRLQDCESMIRAYDEDGDGRICLSEFKGMLQCAA